MTTEEDTRILSELWDPPAVEAGRKLGEPLACITTTYTFHASFFETELLPRFLGLRTDASESGRSFVLEREQALSRCYAAVLVDDQQVDADQTTLRWDQLPVVVPGGRQHAKVTVLLWEHWMRIVVASANATRSGYRHNHEMAAVLDFYDGDDSMPRALALEVLAFLEVFPTWIRAPEAAIDRLRSQLTGVRGRLESWEGMPEEARKRGVPRVAFAPTVPALLATDGRKPADLRSPFDVIQEMWGPRRASTVTVMTPFVGEVFKEGADGGTVPDPAALRRRAKKAVEPLVEQLPKCSRSPSVELVVPGRWVPDRKNGTPTTDLPEPFWEAWKEAWELPEERLDRYIVPLREEADSPVRSLHAKGIFLSNDDRSLLLCGSSNFSPHGFGIRSKKPGGRGVANLEANLCLFDDASPTGRPALEYTLPVNWVKDKAAGLQWSKTAPPPPPDEQGFDAKPLPKAFLWAGYNERDRELTLAIDPGELPTEGWTVRSPGEDGTSWFSGASLTSLADGKLRANVPEDVPRFSALVVRWREEGQWHQARMAIVVEDESSLLEPEELRDIGLDAILDMLLAGSHAGSWIDKLAKRAKRAGAPSAEVDSLRSVDTTGYLLYRARRFGRGLREIGRRLLRTPSTEDAVQRAVFLDFFGPMQLAQALENEWKKRREHAGEAAFVLFGLAELSLLIAHAADRRWNALDGEEEEIQRVFQHALTELAEQETRIRGESEGTDRALAVHVKRTIKKARTVFEEGGTSHAR